MQLNKGKSTPKSFHRNNLEHRTLNIELKPSFTLLELLIYITLALIVSSITLYIYVNTTYGIKDLQKNNVSLMQKLSIINQLEKQIFSLYKSGEFIKLDSSRLSFYTMYPVFYNGIVRSEYYFDPNEKAFYYEEYPYIDKNLGGSGLKKTILGKFENVKFYTYKDNVWVEAVKNNDFSKMIKLEIDNESYYLVLE